MKRIGQGDRGSFEELYDRFSSDLFCTAYRVLNNQVAAEDVLQDEALKGIAPSSGFFQVPPFSRDVYKDQG